jgi:uncharacterized membrane protein YdfJ with MMPL/SSD domain
MMRVVVDVVLVANMVAERHRLDIEFGTEFPHGERFDITGDNGESVAYGLRTTGALITGAAIIMVAVFAGFAAGVL